MTSSRLVVLAAITAAVVAPSVRADDEAEGLRKDTWRAVATTAGALVAEGLIARVSTTECRICESNRLDTSVRDALRWSDTAPAQRASDVLANLAIPLLAVADAARSTRTLGGTARDVLVVAEAASLSSLSTTIAKEAFARRRPGLPTTGPTDPGGNHSLWSGHTSFAFSVAVAQAMQDTLREDAGAPWAWAVGLTLASAVGYFRIAADAHWLTDVVAGAAVGSAFGVGVPLFEKRLVGVTIAPAPGGVALRF
jgi:membrane-associated phospholipid phosphatase